MHQNIKNRLNSENTFYHLFLVLFPAVGYKKSKEYDTEDCNFVSCFKQISWSLTLREQTLRVFKNRVLRRMFGTMRVDVT